MTTNPVHRLPGIIFTAAEADEASNRERHQPMELERSPTRFYRLPCPKALFSRIFVTLI